MKIMLDAVTQQSAHLDPLNVYEEAVATWGRDQAYLLESCGGPVIDNRTSHVGVGKLFEIQAWGQRLTVRGATPTIRRDVELILTDLGPEYGVSRDAQGGLVLADVDRMWALLKAARGSFAVLGDDADQVQFLTHLGYEAARYTENVHRQDGREPLVPDLSLALFQDHYIFDGAQTRRIRTTHPWWGVLTPGPDNTRELQTLTTGRAGPATVTQSQFEQRVETCLELIRAGEIYQVQIGHELQVPSQCSPVDLYRRLRAANPSPYMFLTGVGSQTLIGASPELFLRVEDGRAIMRPIAGTASRSGSTEQDMRVATELSGDPKEVAEHIMLIDLCRNDLARVCQPGTVEVPSLMSVDNYSHVMHLVSTVQGSLEERADIWDAVAATFPAGTMTGAPKIRSMEVITDLETSSRGMYAGAVGHLSVNGTNANLALCIRMISYSPHSGYSTRASAGIVAESVAAREWQETLAKMRASVAIGDDTWAAA